jgi:multidrug resistance efflux pump
VKKGELLAEIDAKDFEIQARTDSAEIARLTTLLEQADRLVERQAKLVEKGFVSQNVVDDATAQRNAQRDQLAAARAQRAGAAQHRQGEGRRAAGRRDRAPGRRRGRLRQGRRPAVHAGRHARAARAAAAGVARRTARPSRMRSEVISGSSTYPRESLVRCWRR